MPGIKHLIECHCILPIYKNKSPVVYHKFAVYSKVDDSDNIIPKVVNCNNCGITHKVYEICKSDIQVGDEDLVSARTIEDVAVSLPEKIVKILKEYDQPISTYEEIEDIIDSENYPQSLVIKREFFKNEVSLKILNIISHDRIKIESHIINTVFLEE